MPAIKLIALQYWNSTLSFERFIYLAKKKKKKKMFFQNVPFYTKILVMMIRCGRVTFPLRNNKEIKRRQVPVHRKCWKAEKNDRRLFYYYD
jgi:hypothetical protein